MLLNKRHSLLNEVCEIIQTIPNVKELKTDPEFLLLVCRIIENKMGKNKQNIDKKDLVISILDKIFTLTEQEKEMFRSNIQFLYDNNKIKKVSIVKLAILYVGEWVSRRFL